MKSEAVAVPLSQLRLPLYGNRLLSATMLVNEMLVNEIYHRQGKHQLTRVTEGPFMPIPSHRTGDDAARQPSGRGDALCRGDRGSAVIEIRVALAALGLLENPDDNLTTGRQVAADVFDAELDHAVRAFQQRRGLIVDGIVGEATYRALKEASYQLGARTLIHQFGAPMYGDDVATLQSRLQDLGFYTGLVDGYFGLQTHNSLMSYQREYGLSPDGICGPETLRSLYFLGSRVTGGSIHAIREEELVRRSGPKLSGKRIIIDPGWGGANHGMITQGPHGPISEADILWDLASRLEGRMTAIGMDTFLSRPANRNLSDAERASVANNVGADLMISLRFDTQPTTSASGVASFYFGSSHGSVSTIGRNLADFIQREVVARTGLQDCRTHGRTWDLLRLTRMPTVQVDVGYITNARDRGMLVTAECRDAVAEGILAAVKRLYLLGKNDRPTGTFTFAELLAHELSVEQASRPAL